MRQVPFLLLLPLFLFACKKPAEQSTPTLPDIPFKDEGEMTFLRNDTPLVHIKIEIADNDSTRTRGLMQRSSLPDKSGMLFIFDLEEPQSFWMANTQLPLDILFVNADSQIVSISKYTTPLSPESVSSGTNPAQYVIEVVAGFCDTFGIIESDRVRWHRTS